MLRYATFILSLIALAAVPASVLAQESDDTGDETIFIQFDDVDVFAERDRPLGETYMGTRNLEFPSLLDLDQSFLPDVSDDAELF